MDDGIDRMRPRRDEPNRYQCLMDDCAVDEHPLSSVSRYVTQTKELACPRSTSTRRPVWGGGSGHTYTFARRPDGTTDLDAVVVREGKNIKGRVLGFVLGIFGERVLGRELAKTVKAIEARNDGARATKVS